MQGFGGQVLYFRFRVSGSGFQISGFWFQISGSDFRFPGCGGGVAGFGFQVSPLGFPFSGFGLQISGFGFRDGYQVRDTSWHVCGLRFVIVTLYLLHRVSGFGFRVWG